MRLDRTGFPPAPRAPLRSAPRIGEKYSGALERNGREGMTERGYARSPATASSLHFRSMIVKYVRISCGGNFGPYRETERKPLYDTYLQQLLDEDKAYRCFCTKDELEAERRKAEAEHRIYRYGGTCAHLSAEQVEKNIAEGKPYAVRLRIPQEDVVVHDLIRGDVEFKSEEFDDFVIARQNGIPIYNFATVIDDALMKITHVIRAEEHLSNTPRQVFIYRALGF